MTADTLDGFFSCCPGMLFIAESDGQLRRCSRVLTETFGHQLDGARSLARLDSEGDGRSLAGLLTALAGSDLDAEHSCVLRTRDAAGAAVELECRARRDREGAIHGELRPRATKAQVPVQTRLEKVLLDTLMETLDIILWAVDDEGKFLFQSGKALAQAGLEPGQFLGMSIFDIYPPEIHAAITEVFAGRKIHNLREAHGIDWENWMLPLRMDDDTTYCAGITLDVSDRLRTERSLERQLETIQSQQRAIYELSAPVLNVWDKVLAVPLIGSMDTGRTDELTDRLLAAAHRSQTQFVILDLTGVEAVDTSIASHVLRLLGSLRLLGVEGMVTGVSPEVARTMVGVGIDFQTVMTHRTLREGLRHCMFELFELFGDG